MNTFKYIPALLAIVLFFAACKYQKSPAVVGTDDVQQQWDAMMVIHDQVMPKMSDINRLKKQLRQDTAQLALTAKLTEAEEGMWAWMHELKPFNEVQLMPTPEAKNYIRQETEKIQAVSRLMDESIGKAETIISKNSAQ